MKTTDVVPGTGGFTPGAVTTTVTPACGKGRFVRGGGYGVNDPAAGLVSGPLVFSDILGSRGWSVSVATIAGEPEHYTAFGYCRPS